MKKKVIKLFQKRIAVLYANSRELLLHEKSYSAHGINFKNIHLFLSFLENTLEKPYNRLCALSVFINNSEHFRTDLMYPFALLTIEAKKSIEEKEAEGIKLATALEVGEINENFEELWRENQLEKSLL